MNVGFIGVGAAGTTLALALSTKGYRVVAVASRGGESARRLAARIPGCQAFASGQEVADACDMVFIATPDGAIASVVASVRWRQGQMAVHVSGALGLEPLAPARQAGAVTGSFHPLQTLALPALEGLAAVETPAEALAALAGVAFAIEAEGPLRAALESMARALGGTPLCIRPEDRPLYHASAVMACGYLLALVSESASLWETMGFAREQALRALLPLAKQTLSNAARKGMDASVTGPIVRGDADTVRRHMVALASRAPHLSSLYSQLGLASLPIAKARGVPPEVIQELQSLLNSHSLEGSHARGAGEGSQQSWESLPGSGVSPDSFLPPPLPFVGEGERGGEGQGGDRGVDD